jgi:hypothetical protein
MRVLQPRGGWNAALEGSVRQGRFGWLGRLRAMHEAASTESFRAICSCEIMARTLPADAVRTWPSLSRSAYYKGNRIRSSTTIRSFRIWPPRKDNCETDGGESHSVMIRSAHSTIETKIAGVPNFAPHWFKSASVTPRAREQAPQEKTGMCLATTLSRVSLSGGQPTGMIAFTVALRMVLVASPVRKICTS